MKEREYVNPLYFKRELDLRANKLSPKVARSQDGQQDNTHLVPTNLTISAYQNPNSFVMIQKHSNENRKNIYTNTRSFAKVFNRSAPKYKIQRVGKLLNQEPQVGYYDH